jgi:hypothetical protein
MTDGLSPDLIRQGWLIEAANHRDNLRRELEAASRHLAAAQEGVNNDTSASLALRQLVSAATAAQAYGAALDALRRAEFALPDDKEN